MGKNELVVGVDVGGTNTDFGILDKDGNYFTKGRIKTKEFPTFELFVKVLIEKINASTKKINNETQIKGIGIGAPNGNYYTGIIDFAPNLPWKGKLSFADEIHKHWNKPIILTNDANAAAIGEMIYGGAKKMKDFIVITLGTGLGSGIVVNGNLVYGHDGFAGEIGHTTIFPDGRQCGCGRRGCLETYCSATGLQKTYIELSKIQTPTSSIDAKYIYDKAMGGDQAALASFKKTGEILGFALANSVVYTSPEAIFLYGGLVNAGDLIFKPTIESFEKSLLNIYKGKIKILPSLLKESDAAVLGAASLIWNEL